MSEKNVDNIKRELKNVGKDDLYKLRSESRGNRKVILNMLLTE